MEFTLDTGRSRKSSKNSTKYWLITKNFRLKKKETIRLFVTSTYLPSNTYSDEGFDEILDQLQNIINKCPKDAIPIIGGDFNVSIGVKKGGNGTTGTFFGSSNQKYLYFYMLSPNNRALTYCSYSM